MISLKKKILNKKIDIAIIGLGYVGLELALNIAKKKYNVIGFDKNKKKIELIKKNKSPINTIKNDRIRLLNKRPLIAYTIEIANAFIQKYGGDISLSTDDKEIAELAKINGANVPFYRSKNNSGDYATTTDVIKEVLNFLLHEKRNFLHGFSNLMMYLRNKHSHL